MLRNEGNLQEGLGYLFEKWYANILGVPEDRIEEIVGGANKNKPDLIWEGKIYSIKLRVDIKNKRLKFSQSNDLSPEYLEAKKRDQNYFLIFMNTKWSQKLIIKEIDPFNDPDEIIVSKPQKIKRFQKSNYF